MGKNKKDYIPTDKYELGTWSSHLARVATRNVGKYGIDTVLADRLNNLSVEYNNDLNVEQDLIEQKRVQVRKTNDDRKDLVDLSRTIAQMVKANPAYTDQIGREFDIIGAEVDVDVNTAYPTLKVRKIAIGWELSFGLDRYFSGVNIYRKRPEEADFRFIATDTRSPYIDGERMINGTQYFAVYILGDTEVGKKSNVVTISV